MKYVLFYEGPAARGIIGDTESYTSSQEAMKDEKKYGKVILEGHQYATGKGIAIVEFDDPKQIANRMALNSPMVKYKIMPLIKGKVFQESMREHGK